MSATAGREPWRRDLLLVCAVLLAAHALPLLVHRDLWVQDEARYGEILREMLGSGRWLVPHLNGHPYPDKPPVYFWMVAGVAHWVQPVELAFRTFTVFSTALATLGTWLLGRALAGRTAGLWAALVYLTVLVSLVVGQIARMDMLLAAATVFAWLALLRLREGGGGGAALAFWLCSALALAVKGPIALAFTLLPALAWLPLDGGREALRRLRPLTGIAGLALGVLGWIGAVLLAGEGDYLRTIWHEQLVGRAVNSWSHKEPVWFYAALLPLLLLPWTGPACTGARVLWRERPAGTRFLALSAALPLLAISLVSGKLFIYVQPLVPALAVIAGIGCARLAQAERLGALQFALPPLYALLLALGIAFGTHDQLADDWRGHAIALAALVLAGLALWLPRAQPQRWLAGTVALGAACGWLLFAALLPLVDPLFSARALGTAIARVAPQPREVAIVHSTRGILNLYAGRLLTEVDREDARAWWQAHPQGVLVIQAAHLKYVFDDAAVPASCKVNDTHRVELKAYHVIADC